MSTQTESAPAAPARRILLKLALAALGGLLLLELSLRVLLFSDFAAGTQAAARLRQPGRWSTSSSDLYWQLVHRWKTSEAPTIMPPHDPRLGWTWWSVEPRSYRHVYEYRLVGRRPVLLFGDSYSACLTAPGDCFQDLMEASRMTDDLFLLNYGVCGYGLDQIQLLLDAALDQHLERRPIVVVGLLIDDDLNRSLLELREHPKPRLRVVDGVLRESHERVLTTEQYFAGPIDWPASWAWRLASRTLAGDPLDHPDSRESRAMGELNRLILRACVERLRASGVEYFFLLFHSMGSSEAGASADWRHQLVCAELDALDAPWYDVRPELRARVVAGSSRLADHFIPNGEPGQGHYSAQGNEVAFAVLQRGLREVAGIDDSGRAPPRPWSFRTISDAGPRALAAYSLGASVPQPRIEHAACILLRADRAQSLTAAYTLEQRAKRFRATLWIHDPDGADEALELEARVDGTPVWSRSVRPSDDLVDVELDLTSAQSLQWVVAPQASRACAVLSDPSFE